jgi:hypothetical protein
VFCQEEPREDPALTDPAIWNRCRRLPTRRPSVDVRHQSFKNVG